MNIDEITLCVSASSRLRVSQEITASLGNIDLLKLHKIAFLCSRKIPASAVLKCYDWAIAQREEGNCIIGGFHSTIEKDVFHYLLAGTQPVIMALARGMLERLAAEVKGKKLSWIQK